MALSYVLTAEGRMDQMLMPLIDWALVNHAQTEFRGRWADPSVFSDRSKDVATRLAQTLLYYPSDIVFVHRDTDKATFVTRIQEIADAHKASSDETPVLCVVPVRMTEAWYLFDAVAIRKAASNPNGRSSLNLPNARQAQRLSDPKDRLEDALLRASETTGRRRDLFRKSLAEKKWLVASHIRDFSPLRQHPAFAGFEKNLRDMLVEHGWG